MGGQASWRKECRKQFHRRWESMSRGCYRRCTSLGKGAQKAQGEEGETYTAKATRERLYVASLSKMYFQLKTTRRILIEQALELLVLLLKAQKQRLTKSRMQRWTRHPTSVAWTSSSAISMPWVIGESGNQSRR